MRRPRRHWRFFLLRWHRRAGVVLGFFLVWMSLSGVALNHAEDVGLDQRYLEGGFWLSRYGSSAPLSLVVGRKEFLLSSQGLQSGGVALGNCDRFLGVRPVSEGHVLACDTRIVLLTRDGEVVEQTDAGRGLNAPLDAMASGDGPLRFRVQSGDVLVLDPFDLSLTPAATPQSLRWLPATPAPAAITLERLMLDLHSGRFFGAAGPWLVDALALSLILLALSGWRLARRRSHANVP